MATHDRTAATPPPRENLIRAIPAGALEFRAAADDAPDDGRIGTMFGHFAVFNEWTEIDSWMEGHFMERIAPGAFAKTFRENRDGMRVTLNHGFDPQAGDKPLGPIDRVGEDNMGAEYEVGLIDTSYNRDILPGLKADLYGASFRFSVMRDELVQEPKTSEDNPKGLPERTLKELRVYEFGPVTFPAYADATAGARSLTDDFMLEKLATLDPERLRQLLTNLPSRTIIVAPDGAGEAEREEAAPPESAPAEEATPTTSAARTSPPPITFEGSESGWLHPARRERARPIR